MYKVRVLGKTYQVNPRPKELMRGNLGTVDVVAQRIDVDDSLKRDQLNDTLLHEVLHVICTDLQIDLSEADTFRLACGLHSAGAKIKHV